MSVSETNTPASTSTSVTATGNDSVTLADEIKKYNTEDLISFLRGQDLELSETALKILEDEEVNGRDFLKITEEKLRSCGMKMGPASRLADFAKECKEKKRKAFSSYHSLRDVLKDYDIESEGIEAIPLFTPPAYQIRDNDKHFDECITEINKS